MTTTNLSLEEIYNLALKTLKFNGCDDLNAEAVAHTVTNAEKRWKCIPGFLEFLDISLL